LPTPTEGNTVSNIHSRITSIIADLPAIGKDSEISGGGQRYKYRGIDDIMPSIKGLLAKHGVHLAPTFSVIDDQSWEVARDRGGSTRWRHVTISGTYRFYGAEGDYVEVTTIGEGKDSADKAFNKAMTAALKYALIQTFAIADGEDPDVERPESPGHHRAAPPSALSDLIGMRDALKAAGKYDEVVAFAAEQGAELRPGTPDDAILPVLAFARQQLA
jgi:hypothetical protein